MVTNSLKRYISNFSWLSVAELSIRGTSFVAAILIARTLGEEQFGIYSYVISLVFIFGALADFGISPIMISEVAKDNRELGTFLRYGTSLKLSIAFIAFSLIMLTGMLFGKSVDVLIIIAMAACWMISNSMITFYSSVFQAFENMHLVAFIRLIEKSSLLIALIVISIFGLSLETVFAAFILAAFLGLCITVYIVQGRYHRFALDFNLQFSKGLLRKSLPLAISGFAFMIYNRVDIIMLSSMQGDQAAGLYSACYNLYLLIGLIPVLATAAVFPSFSNLYVTRRGKMRQNCVRGLKILILLAVLVAVPTFFAASWLIGILYGDTYAEAAPALKILTISVLFSFPSHFLSRLLIIIEKQQWVFRIMAVTAAMNIVLNIALIPAFSYNGASTAMLITEIMALFMSLIVTREILLKV